MTHNDLVALMSVLTVQVECGALRGSPAFEAVYMAETGNKPVSYIIVARAAHGQQCYEWDRQCLRETARFFVRVGELMTELADKADATIEECKRP